MPAAPPRLFWILAAIALFALWFANLGGRALLHPDEGRYAEIGREMAEGGDWVTPRLNGLKYFEKPPLQYWITAATFKALGIGEGPARLGPALAGAIAVVAVALAGWRIATVRTGLYAGFVLAGTLWHAGVSHLLSLDAALNGFLAVALAAFLSAQRNGEDPSRARRLMWMAWAAVAAATLTKGPIGIAIPAGALVFYSLMARDVAVWRRLQLLPGAAIVIALCAPWFIAVSRENPEFAQFFFVHEHVDRFLTTEHKRTGEWWYFVPLVAIGLTPWLLAFVWTARSSWREGRPAGNGFSWQRFCLAWAAFVFVFFSASGSKLPSYILPMFPALALPVAWQLTRIPARTLFWLTMPFAVLTVLVALGVLAGWDAVVAQLPDTRTPALAYAQLRPWGLAASSVCAAAGLVALAAFRRDSPSRRSCGIVALALGTLAALQLALAGNDAFRSTRSAGDILAAARSAPGLPFDGVAPFFQVHAYDQTLPFYLGRTTPLVAYRDEFGLGLDAEPSKGYPTEGAWIPVWQALPQGYAMIPLDDYEKLVAQQVPMRELARDLRRVVVARH